MSESSGTVERVSVRLSPTAVVIVVAAVVTAVLGRRLFVAAHRPIGWAAAAVVAAVLLDPIVDRLAVHIRRVPAVLLTFAIVGGAAVGVAYRTFDDLDRASHRLRVAAPLAATRIEQRDDSIGALARETNLSPRVDAFVADLSARVTTGDEVLVRTLGTAPTYLIGAILTGFLMTFGPRLTAAALAQDRDLVRRGRLTARLEQALHHARRTVVDTLLVGAAVGVMTALSAQLLHLPAPAALGVTAMCFAVLPHVGILLGATPLLLLTLGLRQGTVAPATILAVVLVAQAVDSLVVRRRIARHGTHLGLLVPWATALLGFAVYGIGAAAYGLAYVTFGLAVLDASSSGAFTSTPSSSRRA